MDLLQDLGGDDLLVAGQVQMVAQCIQKRLARVGEEFHRVAVYGGGDVNLAHAFNPFARS